MDRTPGSLIEEKDYSLVWHYRKSEPELASNRARELKEALLQFTTNLGLGVLEGNKVIEVKNAGINKGHAALKWVANEYFDFILAAGDDRTDEDIFHVLPDRFGCGQRGFPDQRTICWDPFQRGHTHGRGFQEGLKFRHGIARTI